MHNPYYTNPFEYSRLKTRIVDIGGVPLGGNFPIRVQSMTNTKTQNTSETVKQCIQLIEAGCDYVRIAATNIKDAKNLLEIKNKLKRLGYRTPLIADVHFNPKVAEISARFIEKIRINPGNYVDKKIGKRLIYSNTDYNAEIEKIAISFVPLIKICKEYGTAIRIGSNHGSLSDRIVSRYGDTPEGMVEAAMEFVKICENEGYYNLVLSMKSSNTRVMIHAYRLLASKMIENGNVYPLHLGVTEAGDGNYGRIKSASGIGSLLEDGIGDTIRVSLTEDPVNEIPVAKSLAGFYNSRISNKENLKIILPYNSFSFKKRKSKVVDKIGGERPIAIVTQNKKTKINNDYSYEEIENSAKILQFKAEDITVTNIKSIADESEKILIIDVDHQNILNTRKAFYTLEKANIDLPVLLKVKFENISKEELQLKASVLFSSLLTDGLGDGIWLENSVLTNDENETLMLNILQACRSRISTTEFISCPTCARTNYNITETLQNIKNRTNHLKGMTIAVMGCIVNGPGEMADADYGYVGSSLGIVNLYKNKEVVKKNIPEQQAIEALIALIKENGEWIEPL